jgi:hypothetical protein
VTVRFNNNWKGLTEVMKEPDVRNAVLDDATEIVMEKQGYDMSLLSVLPGTKVVEVEHEGKVLGYFVLTPHKTLRHVYDVHTLLSKECRGIRALNVAEMGLDLVFNGLDCEILRSQCPDTNKASLLFALRMGFKPMTKEKDWMKNGVLYESTHVSMTREQWEERRQLKCQ